MCSPQGLMKALNLARERGVDVRLRVEHDHGEVALKRMSTEFLDEQVRRAREEVLQRVPLKERTHGPNGA